MTTFLVVTGIVVALLVVLASSGRSIPLRLRPAFAGAVACSGFTSIIAIHPAVLGDRISRSSVFPSLAGAIRASAAPPYLETVSLAVRFEASLTLREV
jgi:hypothetical protein